MGIAPRRSSTFGRKSFHKLPRFVEMIMNVPGTEELIDLVEQLRAFDFNISTQQCIAAQNLLIALAAHEQLHTEQNRLGTLLAPVLCTSPEEQELFYKHFQH